MIFYMHYFIFNITFVLRKNNESFDPGGPNCQWQNEAKKWVPLHLHGDRSHLLLKAEFFYIDLALPPPHLFSRSFRIFAAPHFLSVRRYYVGFLCTQ